MSSEYAEFFEEFMEESRDHLNTMNLSLLEIEKEKTSPDKEKIDNLFRAAHTVKGLAGMMEFESVEALCHAVEDLMDLVRNGQFQLNDASFQALFSSLDVLETLLDELSESKITETPVAHLIEKIHACIAGGGGEATQEPQTAAPSEPSVDIDFDYNFEEFVISEIEKLKIEGSVKGDRFIYEITVDLEGGTPLEDLEELPFIDNYTDIGTILLFSPPLREIEAANETIPTIILVSSELNEQQFALEVNEPYEVIRRGKDLQPEEPVQEAEAIAMEEETSFSGEDYSQVPFCEDISLVDTEILEGYNADVAELIEELDLALIELEKSPDDMDTINSVFRVAHTIKGTSAMFGFTRVVELTHRLENLFDDIRKEKIKIDASIMDVVFMAVDKLGICLNEIRDMEDNDADITQEVNRIIGIVENYSGQAETSEPKAAVTESSTTKEGQRFEIDGFDLTEANWEFIEKGFARGESLYNLAISYHDNVMESTFDPMNIFMLLEMIGDVVSSSVNISAVPVLQEFDPKKFYLKYQYLIVSEQSVEEMTDMLSDMEQVIIDTLIEVGSEATAPQQEAIRAPKPQHKQAPVPTQPTPSPSAQTAPAQKVAAASIPKAQPKAEPKKEAKKEQAAGKLAAKTSTTIRVDIERLDKLLNLVGEFVIDRTRYMQIGEDLKREHPNSPHAKMLNETNMFFGRHMNEIQNVILSVRMVPIGNAFNKFPRVVRDLARTLEKDIELILFGEETELDKTLVEEIGDPLVHLVRNSVDHGIEMPDEREKNGKPRKGTIKMSAFQEGNNIVIEIEDDGGGINKTKILEKAIQRGLVDEEAQLSDKEVFNLIFEPGFSTADVVSNVSGRGVGMDVVKRNIEKLKGIIDIESEIGKGSTITIKLPLTLAIVQALVVTCGTELLAIPLASVVETVRIDPEEVKMLQGKEMINLRNNVLPLINLSDFYGFKAPKQEKVEEKKTRRRKNKKKRLFVVIVGLAEKRLGLVVDSLKTQQEIVIKSIGKLLNNALGISGGTIMGDGNIVLIVDVAEVINNADTVKAPVKKKEEKPALHQGKTILLYNKSPKVVNNMKDFLEDFDLVISRNEEDISKKMNYYDIDLIIAEHQESNEINWKDILLKNSKEQSPIIFLTGKNVAAKRGRKKKNEVFLPEAIEKKALLGQIDKLM